MTLVRHCPWFPTAGRSCDKTLISMKASSIILLGFTYILFSTSVHDRKKYTIDPYELREALLL